LFAASIDYSQLHITCPSSLHQGEEDRKIKENMESVIEQFNAAVASGPDRVMAGAVIAAATAKGI